MIIFISCLLILTSARLVYVDWRRLEIELETLPFWFGSIALWHLYTIPVQTMVIYFIAASAIAVVLHVLLVFTALKFKLGYGDVFLMFGTVFAAPLFLPEALFLVGILQILTAFVFTKLIRGKRHLRKHLFPGAPSFVITTLGLVFLSEYIQLLNGAYR